MKKVREERAGEERGKGKKKWEKGREKGREKGYLYKNENEGVQLSIFKTDMNSKPSNY